MWTLIGGLFLKHLDKLIIVAIIGCIALFAWGRIHSYGKQRYNEGKAEVQAVLDKERLDAANYRAAMERRYRQMQQETDDTINANRTLYAQEKAADAVRIAKLDGTRRELLDHIGRLAKVSATTNDYGATIRTLQQRIETLGVLYGQTDQFAQECVGDAEQLVTDNRHWRKYGDAAKELKGKFAQSQ